MNLIMRRNNSCRKGSENIESQLVDHLEDDRNAGKLPLATEVLLLSFSPAASVSTGGGSWCVVVVLESP